jgi:hypothetical protein
MTMTQKFHIQDRVKIGRFEHLGPLVGRVGEIVSFASVREDGATYQRCNIVSDGERLALIDSRVLVKVESK